MTSPRALLAAHNISPKKQLGQNFIIDPAFTEKIVKCAGILPEDIVLEIGAGLGALTIPLARRARKVIAIEKDRQIVPILNTEVLVSGLTNISIIEKDILSVDINALIEDMGGKIVVMGNLP
ncbi:MAG: ribosomal RNA small subunit methyltransferase A, partial [Desulfobacterales bacterium]